MEIEKESNADFFRQLGALKRLSKTRMVPIKTEFDKGVVYSYPISEYDYSILEPVLLGHRTVIYEFNNKAKIKLDGHIVDYKHYKIDDRNYIAPIGDYWANIMELIDSMESMIAFFE